MFEICITKFEHVQEILVAGKVLSEDDFQMPIIENVCRIFPTSSDTVADGIITFVMM